MKYYSNLDALEFEFLEKIKLNPISDKTIEMNTLWRGICYYGMIYEVLKVIDDKIIVAKTGNEWLVTNHILDLKEGDRVIILKERIIKVDFNINTLEKLQKYKKNNNIPLNYLDKKIEVLTDELFISEGIRIIKEEEQRKEQEEVINEENRKKREDAKRKADLNNPLLQEYLKGNKITINNKDIEKDKIDLKEFGVIIADHNLSYDYLYPKLIYMDYYYVRDIISTLMEHRIDFKTKDLVFKANLEKLNIKVEFKPKITKINNIKVPSNKLYHIIDKLADKKITNEDIGLYSKCGENLFNFLKINTIKIKEMQSINNSSSISIPIEGQLLKNDIIKFTIFNITKELKWDLLKDLFVHKQKVIDSIGYYPFKNLMLAMNIPADIYLTKLKEYKVLKEI